MEKNKRFEDVVEKARGLCRDISSTSLEIDGEDVIIEVEAEPEEVHFDGKHNWVKAWIRIPGEGVTEESRGAYRELLELYPELKDFDEKTGERGLMKACIDFIVDMPVNPTLKSPIIIGTYLTKILDCPDATGATLMDYYNAAMGTCKLRR